MTTDQLNKLTLLKKSIIEITVYSQNDIKILISNFSMLLE